jgi:hypothetical protein
METKDINGLEIKRGDFVRPSMSSCALDPTLSNIGPGQVIHVFSDSITVKFATKTCVANSGLALEKC